MQVKFMLTDRYMLIGVGAQRTGQFFHEEQLAGHGGNETGGDRCGGTVTKSHPEAHSLPLHTAAEYAVSTANGVVGVEDHPGADGVGVAGD